MDFKGGKNCVCLSVFHRYLPQFLIFLVLSSMGNIELTCISNLPISLPGVGGSDSNLPGLCEWNKPYRSGAAHLTTVAAHNVNSASVRWQMLSQGLWCNFTHLFPPLPPSLSLFKMEASLFPLQSNVFGTFVTVLFLHCEIFNLNNVFYTILSGNTLLLFYMQTNKIVASTLAY